MDPRLIGPELERDERLDTLVRPMRDLADALPREGVRLLRGTSWLGHPLHPVLTDLPIGFWTSAFVLDLVPVRRTRPLATAMVALGVLSATPTAAAGLASWSTMSSEKQRAGAVHAVANASATVLYALSLGARLRKRRLRGVALGMAGAAAATIGAHLGGHLVFGSAASEPAAPAQEEAEDARLNVSADGITVTAAAGAQPAR